jgi:formylglycine-generating enzyme required for sulfatase activity
VNLRFAAPVQTVVVEGTSRAPSTPAASAPPFGPVPEMVAIPAGTFTMGSAIGEEGRSRNEGPTHVVTVPAFEIGTYEVTVEQFQAYADDPRNTGVTAGGCAAWNGKWATSPDRSWRSPGFEQTPKDPVVCVSWEDAQRYVRWLNQVTKKSYRLASEAEWEYAARASTIGPRYWDHLLDTCRYANVDHAPPNCDDGFERTAPVDRQDLVPNAFGLVDMLGNVMEWTADCANTDYSGAPVKGEAWTAGNCASKMVRGGGWIHGLREVRSASRVGFSQGFRANVVGFRVARTQP